MCIATCTCLLVYGPILMSIGRFVIVYYIVVILTLEAFAEEGRRINLKTFYQARFCREPIRWDVPL